MIGVETESAKPVGIHSQSKSWGSARQAGEYDATSNSHRKHPSVTSSAGGRNKGNEQKIIKPFVFGKANDACTCVCHTSISCTEKEKHKTANIRNSLHISPLILAVQPAHRGHAQKDAKGIAHSHVQHPAVIPALIEVGQHVTQAELTQLKAYRDHLQLHASPQLCHVQPATAPGLKA